MSAETVTLVAAIVAAVAAVAAALISLFAIRRTNYINAIAASRIKWIGELREDFSVLVADAFHIVQSNGHGSYSDEQGLLLYKGFQQKTIKVRLKLNPTDDKSIIEMLLKMENNVFAACTNRDWSYDGDETLISEMQNLLKNEWDKVKVESSRLF